MDIVRILSTLLMIALILVIVKKKYYIVTSFLVIGFVSLLIVTIVTGQSVLGDSTSGSALIDIFEVMADSVTRSLGTTGLVIMIVLGYVEYMKHLKASDLFSLIVSNPLKKIKSPSIVIFFTFVVTIIVKLAIPSASSLVTLLLATIYPILLSVGISRQTAAASLMLSASYVWGPANTLAYTAFSAAGLEDMSVPLYFATKEFIPIIVSVIIGSVSFIFINKYFDKKENVEVEKQEMVDIKTVKQDMGIPSFYAIFPLLPVVLIIIFSQIVLKSIEISVIAAHFLSLIVVLFVELIRKRQIKEVFDATKAFFEGMGSAFKNVVSILIGINVFSAGLSAVGGLPILTQKFTEMGGSAISIAVVTSIGAFALVGIGSSISGTLPLFASLFPQFATSQAGLVNMIRMLIFSGGLGSAINPIAPTTVILSGTCDVPIPTIIKRTIIPAILSMIAIIVTCILIP